jgi:hypothetical protein
MRKAIDPIADRLWREKQAGAGAQFETNAAAQKIYLDIQGLSPQNDLQRSLQSRAARLSNDLVQTRLLLFVESSSSASGGVAVTAPPGTTCISDKKAVIVGKSCVSHHTRRCWYVAGWQARRCSILEATTN